MKRSAAVASLASTVLTVLFAFAAAQPATAAPQTPATPTITAPAIPDFSNGGASNDDADVNGDGTADKGKDATLSLDLGGLTGDEAGGKKKAGQSVTIILLLTILAIAPALLMMVTSFTRIVIVLSLTRNALGVNAIPPNQVIVGLSLFLSLFVMFPTLSRVNEDALKPLMDGKISYNEAYHRAQDPLRDFMLRQTRKGELDLFIKASREERPQTRDDVSMATLVPAFVLSELKTAFIIGFVVFVPFLIIDLVVSSTLMSMGMFMLPPVLVSLPFKLLLFVMVDGWALVVKSLITSFH